LKDATWADETNLRPPCSHLTTGRARLCRCRRRRATHTRAMSRSPTRWSARDRLIRIRARLARTCRVGVAGSGPRVVLRATGILFEADHLRQARGRHADRVAGTQTLEQRMDDVPVLMDSVGSQRAALFGVSEGGAMSVLFAATYPQRVVALVLYGPLVRSLWAPDFSWGYREEDWLRESSEEERRWRDLPSTRRRSAGSPEPGRGEPSRARHSFPTQHEPRRLGVPSCE
jgi:pimeloyl-ACP methyl ester carboxylesterase